MTVDATPATAPSRHPPRAASEAPRAFFNLDALEMRYDPFPIGSVRPLMDEARYTELLDYYPPRELFAYLPKVGHKYVLSEKFNGEEYQHFLRGNPVWREFHAWIKSDAFIRMIMRGLRDHHIDLGLGKTHSPMKQLWKSVKHTLNRNQKPQAARLSTRFEFSMLPADGGHIRPHTDVPAKIVTLVVSMTRDGEWDPAWGGATEVNWPKDKRQIFNQLGEYLPFDAVDILDAYPFLSNQAVIFVKTFNSWHSVRPMTGHGTDAVRKTLTINIEAR